MKSWVRTQRTMCSLLITCALISLGCQTKIHQGRNPRVGASLLESVPAAREYLSASDAANNPDNECPTYPSLRAWVRDADRVIRANNAEAGP